MRRHPVRGLALACALTVAVGCQAGSTSSRGEAPAAEPIGLFGPAAPGVPEGFHEVLCPDLRPEGTGLSVRFVLPDDTGATGYSTVSSCSITAEVDRSAVVALAPSASLEEARDELEPRVDEGGDESVSDVVYDGAATVFGDVPGERLTWTSFNDGLPLDRTTVLADGVSLDWETPAGTRDRFAEALATVERSLGVVRGSAATCWTPGAGSVSYRPPVPQTESIEQYGGRCHVYLRPGRASLLRYAEVDVAPRGSLGDLAVRLRERPGVDRVSLEPAATRLDGRLVDRLTWVIRREKPTRNGEPAGTWRLVTVGDDRIRATWGATPAQWGTEADDARRFFASVRSP